MVMTVSELAATGGNARAASMTAQQRSESAREAVLARWDKYYAAHPEKLAKRKKAVGKKVGRKAGKK